VDTTERGDRGVKAKPKERVSLWITLVSATMGLKAHTGGVGGVVWWVRIASS
jgi:hypothetical protein